MKGLSMLGGKKFLALVCMSAITGYQQAKNFENRPLNNVLLIQFDGFPGGMDGKNVSMMVHIMQETSGMLHGDLENNQLIGRYMFEGKQYSIHGLKRLEGAKKIQADPALKTKLNNLFAEIREDFLVMVKPFLYQAQGAKQITLKLMEEWAENRNRADSFMLSWNHQPEGSELEIFRLEVTSFAQLELFCKDLLSFLDDLISSCPRGWHQYEQLRTKLHQRSS